MILHGDCLEKLRELEAESVDAIVTDPPYGLAFMGKRWDYDVPSVDIWREVLRVLKPGGHALIACGTRTQHRMVVNIEDAGFEIRDVVTWLYGQGFPKSLDISKAIDKAAGAEREVVSTRKLIGKARVLKGGNFDGGYEGKELSEDYAITAPATDAAKTWQGWGTALKPACEFWTLARKPLDGTVAANVLKWGTGGLNIDGCRISIDPNDPNHRPGVSETVADTNSMFGVGGQRRGSLGTGRFPANLILDEEAAAALDEQSGTLKTGNGPQQRAGLGFHGGAGGANDAPRPANEGGASRFFYVAKVSPSERNAGLEGLKGQRGSKTNLEKLGAMGTHRMANAEERAQGKTVVERGEPGANTHPTVKPVKLMRYLCRLVTRPGGLVLDPFTGSGSTGVAALMEGFRFVGIEREAEYVAIAEKRLQAARFEAFVAAEEAARPPEQPTLFDGISP